VETLIGVFVSLPCAQSAVSELQQLGVPQDAITFLTADAELAQTNASGKVLGALLGGMFGGTAGLSLGAAAATLVVPGVGPVLAIGIGAAALLGLGGASAGAALGSSTVQQPDNKVVSSSSPEDAQFFRTVLIKGRSVVIVRTDSKAVAEAACAVLDRLGIGTRRAVEASPSSVAKTKLRVVNGVVIVDLTGRITLGEGSAMLGDTVHDLVEQDRNKIILNLGRVTHIDSSGIGVLVRVLTTVRSKGGQLKLVNVSLPVTEILRITRLASLFDVANDESSGVAALQA
jgi:anti-sigma B factor antagonist